MAVRRMAEHGAPGARVFGGSRAWGLLRGLVVALVLVLVPGFASGQIVEFGDVWPQPPGPWVFHEPTDMALDDAGNFYVVDATANRILKLSPTGDLLLQWGSEGNRPGQFSQPEHIAIRGSGNVYVTDGLNHRVQVFTREGGYLGAWGGAGTGPGEFAGPRGVAVDTAGDVYVVDRGNDRVQKFTPAGGFIREWGGPGNGDG